MSERTWHVYRMFDAEGSLLYVGCSQDASSRIKALTATYNIGKPHVGTLIRRYDHHTVTGPFATRSAALAAERKAIHDEAPELNVNSQRGGRRVA